MRKIMERALCGRTAESEDDIIVVSDEDESVRGDGDVGT